MSLIILITSKIEGHHHPLIYANPDFEGGFPCIEKMHMKFVVPNCEIHPNKEMGSLELV